MIKIKFQKQKISISSVLGKLGTSADGALASFIGRVRNTSNGKSVRYLEYEIYDGMARKELERIMNDAVARWKLGGCVVFHRSGRVKVGDASIAIAVCSRHREESLQAVKYIIDTIKKKVPIWKKEFYRDGSNWITDRV